MFLEINTWAGFKGQTMSGLQGLFMEYMQANDADLRQADAPTLVGFRDWLKETKS